MNTLEQTQKKVEESTKQLAHLRADLKNQKERLEKAQLDQKTSILQGRDKNTDGIENQIVSLMTMIKGTESAIKTLETNLKQYQAEKNHEMNNIRIAQVEEIRNDIRGIFKDIYLLLIDLVGKMKQLEKKRAEYRSVIKSNDDKKLRQFSDRASHTKILIVTELSKIIDGFTYDIFDKDGLPTPDELKKGMR